MPVFENDKKALEAIAHDVLQVSIQDIELLGIDGYELARRLRANLVASSAVMIALTGYDQEHDRALSKAVGCNHHFVKPIDTIK